MISEVLGRDARFVHAAGPAKAMEVARDVFTGMFFPGKDATICAKAMRGDRLVVTESEDIAGAELCSALKNAYATGIGMWDGFVGPESHNARAACFAQSIVEMREIKCARRRPCRHGELAARASAIFTSLRRREEIKGSVSASVAASPPKKSRATCSAKADSLTEGYAAIATATRFAEDAERNRFLEGDRRDQRRARR